MCDSDDADDPCPGTWFSVCRARTRQAPQEGTAGWLLLHDQDRNIIYGICTSFYETFQHQAAYLHNLALPESSICDRTVKRDEGVEFTIFEVYIVTYEMEPLF